MHDERTSIIASISRLSVWSGTAIARLEALERSAAGEASELRSHADGLRVTGQLRSADSADRAAQHAYEVACWAKSMSARLQHMAALAWLIGRED